jgi:hypothetical protein
METDGRMKILKWVIEYSVISCSDGRWQDKATKNVVGNIDEDNKKKVDKSQ